MKIVVLDGYTLNPGDNPWTEVEKLGELVVHERTPADKILERAKGADVLLTNKTPLSADTLKALPGLKFIGVLATGYNVVDVAAARQMNIPVSNIPIYGTDSVAQFAFALLAGRLVSGGRTCAKRGLEGSAAPTGPGRTGRTLARSSSAS